MKYIYAAEIRECEYEGREILVGYFSSREKAEEAIAEAFERLKEEYAEDEAEWDDEEYQAWINRYEIDKKY